MMQGSAHPPRARLASRLSITSHRPNKRGSDTELVGAKVRSAHASIKDRLDSVRTEGGKLQCYNAVPTMAYT